MLGPKESKEEQEKKARAKKENVRPPGKKNVLFLFSSLQSSAFGLRSKIYAADIARRAERKLVAVEVTFCCQNLVRLQCVLLQARAAAAGAFQFS